jgi:hypothetical protein
LQLGRSLASRWQQYSPGPLRRLKKLFSAPERDRGDYWDSESDDVRKEQLESADDVGSSYLETRPLLPGESPVATGSKDSSDFEPVREPQQDINSSLEELRQKPFREELVVSDHRAICSQNLPNESSSDSSNIPVSPLRDPLYNKTDDSHSKTSVPVTEVLHIPQKHGCDDPTTFVPGNSNTGESYDVECNTSILQQPHDFNKQFYVLTASSEDGDDEDRECWQHGAMTQWRRTDSDTCSGKGRVTVQEVSSGSVVAAKEFAVCQGPSGAVDIRLCEEGTMATFINGKLDEEVEVLLKTATSAEVLSVDTVTEATCGEVSCNMARNVEEEFVHKLEDSACDRTVEGIAGRVAVVHESSVVVTKSGMDTPIIVCDVDDPDRSPLPLPNIVLDVSHPPTSSEATSSHSQELHRLPKLQLQIATTCSQSAARKSPVTVQEWVDSLPIHHRCVQLPNLVF